MATERIVGRKVAQFMMAHPNEPLDVDQVGAELGYTGTQVRVAFNRFIREARFDVTRLVSGQIYRYNKAAPVVPVPSPGMVEVLELEKQVNATIAEMDAAKTPVGLVGERTEGRWKLPNGSVPSSRPLFEQVYAFPSGHVMLIDEKGSHWRAEKIED